MFESSSTEYDSATSALTSQLRSAANSSSNSFHSIPRNIQRETPQPMQNAISRTHTPNSLSLSLPPASAESSISGPPAQINGNQRRGPRSLRRGGNGADRLPSFELQMIADDAQISQMATPPRAMAADQCHPASGVLPSYAVPISTPSIESQRNGDELRPQSLERGLRPLMTLDLQPTSIQELEENFTVSPEGHCMQITATGTWVYADPSLQQNLRINPQGLRMHNDPNYVALDGEIKHMRELDLANPRGVLGSGASGTVVLVEHIPTGRLLAVKKLFVGREETRSHVLKEVNAYALVSSPQIVRCRQVFFDCRQDQVLICLEVMDGTLKMLYKALGDIRSERVLWWLARELLKGLAYLHSLGITHRDIKPSNILLNATGEVKITDFGIAINPTVDRNSCWNPGTIYYMSPERLDGVLPTPYPSDVWSVGISLWEVILGDKPFSEPSEWTVLAESRDIGDNVAEVLENGGYSKEFVDFMRQCLRYDYRQRPNAQELLSHEWFQTQVCAEEEMVQWCKQAFGHSFVKS